MLQKLFFVSETGDILGIFIIFFGVHGVELKHLQHEIKDLQHFKSGVKG